MTLSKNHMQHDGNDIITRSTATVASRECNALRLIQFMSSMTANPHAIELTEEQINDLVHELRL